MASLYEPYAALSDYEEYIGETITDTDEQNRITLLLLRASEIVNQLTYMNYDSDDEDHVEAVKLSTCSQVQFWEEYGYGADSIIGFESVKIGSFSIKGKGTGSNASSNPYTLHTGAMNYLERILLLSRTGVKLR